MPQRNPLIRLCTLVSIADADTLHSMKEAALAGYTPKPQFVETEIPEHGTVRCFGHFCIHWYRKDNAGFCHIFNKQTKVDEIKETSSSS